MAGEHFWHAPTMGVADGVGLFSERALAAGVQSVDSAVTLARAALQTKWMQLYVDRIAAFDVGRNLIDAARSPTSEPVMDIVSAAILARQWLEETDTQTLGNI